MRRDTEMSLFPSSASNATGPDTPARRPSAYILGLAVTGIGLVVAAAGYVSLLHGHTGTEGEIGVVVTAVGALMAILGSCADKPGGCGPV